MLTLPPKFKQALGNGTRTSLYPLVRIYKGVQIDDPLDSATEVINLSIKETNIGGEAYNPLLLNSPSISSKADIINNKYTISSVSLSISNAPYKGKIFSDDIPSLLNAVVQVYYAANGLDTLDDCLLVYTGTIRRYSQSAETLSLTLEDLTEQKLKTKIPATLIEDENNFNDENIGKPYPMVYGYVDKSPLILDKYDSLIIDKPSKEIIGLWDKIASVNYQNPKIKDTLLYGTWLQKNSSLFTYKDGYMPIMENFPYNFGSRTHTINEGSMYEFENFTDNSSAKINLNPSNFLYEKYTLQEDEDGEEEYEAVEGNLGIPTRIYRPVQSVSFFVKNHGEYKNYYNGSPADDDDSYTYRPPSANKFYGFFDTLFYTGITRDIFRGTTNYVANNIDYDENNYDIVSNQSSAADSLYNEAIAQGLQTWWQPTEINNNSGIENEGIWSFEDNNFLDNPNFNPDWIQNADNRSGIHIHSVNMHNENGGAFVRLQLNTDVPDYPAVTKIFYRANYFAPSNIMGGTEAEPVAFWHERQLLTRHHNNNDSFGDLVTTKNDWHEYYDNDGGTWTTACEFPNHEHTITPDTVEKRYVTVGLGGEEYDNIILGFNSTKTTDSINWGLPAIKGYYTNVSSCFANLKQFYTIQDILITEYVKEKYYGSVVGRSEEKNWTVNIISIEYVGNNTNIIFTDLPHFLNAGDTFNIYSENGTDAGVFTCTTAPLNNSMTVNEGNLEANQNGTISYLRDTEITKPHNILNDILKEELGYDKGVILPDETIQDDWIHSFTLKEQKETKGVIENLFKSSIYIPSFDSAGNFKFIDLKQNIEDYDQFETIDNQDIVKYSFALTKLEDVKNQVNVKYKKDYGSGDYAEETGYGIEDNNGITSATTLDELTTELTSDMLYDISYYGIKNEDAKLDIETEYIRDKDTARKLQRRLLMWYANQHITMKIDLPPSYIHLEAGDYIKFDELIGGKLAFGFDYTQEFVKNGQLIYPVFFVTKTAKSLSKVSLELVQVHRGDFGMNDDDLGNYKIPNPYMNNIYAPEGEELAEEEIYFLTEWESDYNLPDLQQGQINALVSTNLETGVNIEIRLLDSSHAFNYGNLQITNGINDIEASELVNATINETDNNYGDNVSINKLVGLAYRAGIEYTDDNTVEETIELTFDLIITSDTDPELSETLTFVQNIPTIDFTLGDLNGDEVINVLDIIILVNLILDDSPYNESGDLNGDGALNILDVVTLVQNILGN